MRVDNLPSATIRNASMQSIRVFTQSIFGMVLVVVALLSLGQAASVEAQSGPGADAIVGTWADARGEMLLEFSQCGATYCARIVGLPGGDEAAVDGRNPDRSLRGRSLIGLQIIEGLRFEGPDRYVGGAMYAPQRGVNVDVTFEMISPDVMRATVSRLVFRRTIEWERVRP
jgi:uncharacterized protein (DUF2147 family)